MAALTVTAAFAAEIAGVWTGTATMGDGNSFSLTYTFKVEGATLTGTVLGPQGDPIQIENGKVDGNKFSFTVKVHGDQEMTINNTGVIDGDEITLTTKFEGADFDIPPMKLKRSK